MFDKNTTSLGIFLVGGLVTLPTLFAGLYFYSFLLTGNPNAITTASKEGNQIFTTILLGFHILVNKAIILFM